MATTQLRASPAIDKVNCAPPASVWRCRKGRRYTYTCNSPLNATPISTVESLWLFLLSEGRPRSTKGARPRPLAQRRRNDFQHCTTANVCPRGLLQMNWYAATCVQHNSKRRQNDGRRGTANAGRHVGGMFCPVLAHWRLYPSALGHHQLLEYSMARGYRHGSSSWRNLANIYASDDGDSVHCARLAPLYSHICSQITRRR